MQDLPALQPHIRNRPLAKLCLHLDLGNPAYISGGNLTSHLNNAVQWYGSGLYFLRLFQSKCHNSLDCVWDENAFQRQQRRYGNRVIWQTMRQGQVTALCQSGHKNICLQPLLITLHWKDQKRCCGRWQGSRNSWSRGFSFLAQGNYMCVHDL